MAKGAYCLDCLVGLERLFVGKNWIGLFKGGTLVYF